MRRPGTIAALATALAGGVALGLWLGGGSHVIGVYASPDRRQQLEVDTPARWQRPWFHRGMIPAVARLTDLQADRVVSESGVFEFGGGIGDQIYWTREGVAIGSVATYRRATDRWVIDG